MHGVAWMDSIPDLDAISENWVRGRYPTDHKRIDPRNSARADHEAQEVYDFANALVSTWNPVMNENGVGELPQPRPVRRGGSGFGQTSPHRPGVPLLRPRPGIIASEIVRVRTSVHRALTSYRDMPKPELFSAELRR